MRAARLAGRRRAANHGGRCSTTWTACPRRDLRRLLRRRWRRRRCDAHVRPGLPLESSRGCWWGAAHQCTFCGLNGTSLGYRSKSPERVLAEVHELEDRYGISDFEAVDNILDMRLSTRRCCRDLADGRPPRGGSSMRSRRTSPGPGAGAGRAGIMWVQPGIESLHSEVLALMDKGIQGWQNVQLLKWSASWGSGCPGRSCGASPARRTTGTRTWPRGCPP